MCALRCNVDLNTDRTGRLPASVRRWANAVYYCKLYVINILLLLMNLLRHTTLYYFLFMNNNSIQPCTTRISPRSYTFSCKCKQTQVMNKWIWIEFLRVVRCRFFMLNHHAFIQPTIQLQPPSTKNVSLQVRKISHGIQCKGLGSSVRAWYC